MALLFLNHSKRRIYRAEFGPDWESRHVHSLGKDADAKIAFGRSPIPLHVVLTLDLSDARLGLQLPGIKRLPLCYGFRFGGEPTAYRMQTQNKAELLRPNRPKVDPEFPYADYPDAFPRVPMRLAELEFDPTNPEKLPLAGVFGPAALTKAQQKAVLRNLKKSGLLDELEDEGLSPTELIEAFATRFVQGKPPGDCPNPKCTNYAHEGRMNVFALIDDPLLSGFLWGDYGWGVQLIFEICPKCFAVNASNQAT